ncbi:hypothetical protein Ancab_022792 [Ancistrocladus abbreviatus]
MKLCVFQGIPPVSKTLSISDTWVTVLCKKLAMWWPWVAEGEIPLIAAKGEEICQYKRLDPTTRLLMLKALCEVRAEELYLKIHIFVYRSQDDSVSFVNDAVKQGRLSSSFRKYKIGRDGDEISYWYDGNSVIGYRLYKEVNKSELQPKHRGKACLDPPCTQWKTLATNLEEFRRVLGELLSSKIGAEVAICRTIEADVIPILEKQQKNSKCFIGLGLSCEAALDTVNSMLSHCPGKVLKGNQCIVQVSGNHGWEICAILCYLVGDVGMFPYFVNECADEYDRTIDEAMQLMKEGKATGDRRCDKKHHEHENEKGNVVASDENMDEASSPREGSVESTNEDKESDKLEGDIDDQEDDDHSNDHVVESDNEKDGDGDMGDFDTRMDNTGKQYFAKVTSQVKTNDIDANAAKLHKTKRLASGTGHRIAGTRNPGTKNRLRQRPTRNTAIEIDTIPGSDDGSSADDGSGDKVGHENTCYY